MLGVTVSMKDAQLTGGRVSYVEVEGPSPPIVFLHGLTDSAESYRLPMAMLAGEVRMVAMDFRGHGRSDHALAMYRICDYASDLQEFLTTVVRRPAIVAGHSLGALVAAFTAAVATDLFHGVFLEDAPFYTAQMPALKESFDYQVFVGLRELLRHHRNAAQSVEGLAQAVGTWPIHPMLFEGRSLLEVAGPEAVRSRAESLHRMDVGVLEPVLDGTQFDGFDPDAALAKIAAPVHLLAGEVIFGGTIEQRDVQRLGSVIRRYTHRTLPGVGHLIHHTVPIDYVQEIRSFAGSCR